MVIYVNRSSAASRKHAIDEIKKVTMACLGDCMEFGAGKEAITQRASLLECFVLHLSVSNFFLFLNVATTCALAAHRLRCPVRIYVNRKTDMIIFGGRYPMKITYDVGFKS